ncbi:lysozyme inhibitor LprI family protein [Ectobacillus funiculus]|uniref:lysozyme inhibitor LprI family protein n=1 Tax=Ectobacillus funiculus TaxID=137993 RepID=UPI00101CD342|nr:lysozyme inhibitor LprI family protein [Ectobacillus funiculus]
MKQLLAALFTITLLVGCNNGTYEKAMEQGKLALANREFDKALASFELALKEEPKDKEAKVLYERLVVLNQVKEAIENAKWDDALTKANNLLGNGTLESSVKKELEQYVKTAEASKAQYKTVSEKVAYIKGLVNEGKYGEAQTAMGELKQDASLKPVLDNFSSEVGMIEQTVNTEIMKQKDAEVAAAKKAAAAAVTASKRQEYLQKLDGIAQSSERLFDNVITTVEIREAAGQAYTRWDDALNEIYGILKTQLPTDELDTLKEAQRKWITYRDNTAKAESAEFEGGTFESVQYLDSLGRLTKERCYELVRLYMK